jgi:hypothetical protein
MLLERVGVSTPDPVYGAHWLSEAANVWQQALNDPDQTARTLLLAVEKDPTHRTAGDRLAQLYREKGKVRELAELFERQAKALAPGAGKPEVRAQLIKMHEELGRMWSDPGLAQPERAIESWKKVAELDPRNVYAIYAAREMLKAQQRFAEAIPYFGMEQAVADDPERKLALYRDEADIRKRSGDLPGATGALRSARAIRPDDAALSQELGVSVLERINTGEAVPQNERDEAAGVFVKLAETYDGEYGLSYSMSALAASPGHDRAMQLADHFATLLGRTAEVGPQYAAYLQANPSGFMAHVARIKVGSAQPPAPPAPPAAQPQPVAAAAFAPAQAEEPAQVRASQPAAAPAAQEMRTSSPSIPAAAAAPAAAQAGDIRPLLEEAQAEAQKGKKPQAYAKYREALKIDPANAEALSWVEEHLRQKRMYADLRDVLLAASRVASVSSETRKAQLRDVAGICESQLRDIETAITAWKQICQIDRGDDQAREQLRRLLERAAKWDDLATVLEQDAMGAPDPEQKIALEKKLATLHETKRKDPAAAAEAWARIATLSPEDETAINTAVKLYEKGEKFDLAAQVIADNIPGINDKNARAALLGKLGDLRLKLDDPGAAGDAFAEAAEITGQSKIWEQAEKAYGTAGRMPEAANAIEQRAELTEGKPQAALLAMAADVLLKAGDAPSAIARFERATEIDPTSDAYAQSIEQLYREAGREGDLVQFLLSRGEKLNDRGKRVAARRTAAEVQRRLGDSEGARESLLLVLSDGDDADALALLVDDANQRGDHQECVEFLRRLGTVSKAPGDKLTHALREASILAEGLDDVEGAIERYESILKTLDPKNRTALRAIADLEQRRENPQGAASALEREVAIAEGEEKIELAQRLAQLYEGPLHDPRAAIRVLEIVHAADSEDFDAIGRLERLCEEIEDWPRVAHFLQMLIEVEGDEEEASRMTRRLADILHGRLGRGDEALGALAKIADTGDEPCRRAYVELGDTLGWKGIVATKLVEWNESAAGPARNEAMRGAFERFLEVGRNADAARVAMELARSRGADRQLAERLEHLAIGLKDLDALGVAHDLLAKELSGATRAAELVRQAEVQIAAGIEPAEAISHGESALSSVPAAEAESLLARLSALAVGVPQKIDIYERQVARCRLPADRLTALARAAQVAAEHGVNDRARSFFELALSGGVQEETISQLEAAAMAGDERSGSKHLRTILAEALAGGGQGSRDGGRTKSALLRRAATLAHRSLGDVEKAFKWLGDALVTHVDDPSLDAIEALGREVGDLPRVEATLTRALEEVFDGPLVRRLLQRRARLRRDALDNKKGAAVDLKKLHDLSPSDQDVMNELSALLTDLGDHRGMIQLYEDQILRGRDPAARAELARKVARLWEEELGDARESADAWRRVLRMKAGDAEATAGLDRAKTGKLKRTPPRPSMPSTPPEARGSVPPPARSSMTSVPPEGRGSMPSVPPAMASAPPPAEPAPVEPPPVMAPPAFIEPPPVMAAPPAWQAQDASDMADTPMPAPVAEPAAPAMVAPPPMVTAPPAYVQPEAVAQPEPVAQPEAVAQPEPVAQPEAVAPAPVDAYAQQAGNGHEPAQVNYEAYMQQMYAQYYAHAVQGGYAPEQAQAYAQYYAHQAVQQAQQAGLTPEQAQYYAQQQQQAAQQPQQPQAQPEEIEEEAELLEDDAS